MKKKSIIALLSPDNELEQLLNQQIIFAEIEYRHCLEHKEIIANKNVLIIIDDLNQEFILLKTNLLKENIEIKLQKPFALAKLFLLLEKLFNQIKMQPIHLKHLTLDQLNNRLLVGGREYLLSEKETSLFAYLLNTYPEALSNQDLLRNVWQLKDDIDTQTLTTHIYRLRQKLKDDSGIIENKDNSYFLNL